MITAVLLGAGCGLGLTLLIYGIHPPALSLAAQIEALKKTPPAPRILAEVDDGWASKAGRPFAAFLQGLGLPGAKVARDLAVLERPVGAHLAEKAAGLIGGLLLPLVGAGALSALGMSMPLLATVWFALACSVAGFFIPDLDVTAKAATRRLGVRHALSVFLDLTVVTLAGGSGVEAALAQAADTGDGFSFTQIRRALTTAQHLRVPAAATLGQLGQELQVPALEELSASLTLAGTEGSKIKASLAAKAESLRAHDLSDADAAAQSATEKLSMPTMVMVIAFLLFLGFPAMVHIASGLS
jgi:tight adherence protein C